MQQLFNCQQLVTTIRDIIREEAKNLGLQRKAGFIKISLVPYTDEADEDLGGFSGRSQMTSGGEQIEDYANYEFTYALYPEVGFAINEASKYAAADVKRRRLISNEENETGRVYSWEDFLEVAIRVSGDENNNKKLATIGAKVVASFFEEQTDFSVKIN